MYIISFGGVDFVISVISIILVAISFHEYKHHIKKLQIVHWRM